MTITVGGNKERGRQTMDWVGAMEDSLTVGHDEGKDNNISCKREGGELTATKQQWQRQGERVGVRPF